jgi:hypothetical protein
VTYRRVIPLDITIISADEDSGHEVSINGEVIAYRAYDGSGMDDVAGEVAGALGMLLLDQLRSRDGHPSGANCVEPGSWYEECPAEEW